MNKLELLQEWQETVQNTSGMLERLDKVVGRTDGPLRDSFYRMQATYTKAISLCVGDMHNWLEWYALENEFGTRGLTARAGTGRPMKKIRTLKSLLALIESHAHE